MKINLKKVDSSKVIGYGAIAIICLIILYLMFFFFGSKTRMKVEPLSKEFIWGNDMQYEVTLSGDQELQLATASKQERDVTDIYSVNEYKAIVTVKTELLDVLQYKAVLMYGDEIYFINLKEKGR